MIQNLSQLKKKLIAGAKFIVAEHCRIECVGQLRMIKVADTTGFYSIFPDEPDNKINYANNGKGSYLRWSKASFWDFKDDGICRLYSSDKEKTGEHLLLGIQVLN
jgi:hypothetical protein